MTKRPLSSRVTFAAPRNINHVRRNPPISPHFFPLAATIEMQVPACQRLSWKFMKRSRYLRAGRRAPSRIPGETQKAGLYVDQGLEQESSTIFDFSGGLNRPGGPQEGGESACKPGSVESSHSSGTCVTAGLKRPTRKHARARAAAPLRDCDFPIWPCSRWGLPCRRVLPPTRCALTAPFHPYQHCCQRFGGLLSVALSVGSRPPGVTWHPARRARTFLHAAVKQRSGCPADSPPGHHTGFSSHPQPRPTPRRRCARA